MNPPVSREQRLSASWLATADVRSAARLTMGVTAGAIRLAHFVAHVWAHVLRSVFLTFWLIFVEMWRLSAGVSAETAAGLLSGPKRPLVCEWA